MILWFSRVQHRVQPVHTPPARSDLWCCRLCGSLHSMICRWRRCRSHCSHTRTHKWGIAVVLALSLSSRDAALWFTHTSKRREFCACIGASDSNVLLRCCRCCWLGNGSVASLRWILSRTILSKWKWNSETAREIFELKWIHQRQRQRQRHHQHLWAYPYIENVSRIVANQADVADVADLIGLFF